MRNTYWLEQMHSALLAKGIPLPPFELSPEILPEGCPLNSQEIDRVELISIDDLIRGVRIVHDRFEIAQRRLDEITNHGACKKGNVWDQEQHSLLKFRNAEIGICFNRSILEFEGDYRTSNWVSYNNREKNIDTNITATFGADIVRYKLPEFVTLRGGVVTEDDARITIFFGGDPYKERETSDRKLHNQRELLSPEEYIARTSEVIANQYRQLSASPDASQN